MEESREKLLGTAPLGKLIFQLALPGILAQLINVLYNIIDRMYIGHMEEVGATALTALGVCMPILVLISAIWLIISASIYGGILLVPALFVV